MSDTQVLELSESDDMLDESEPEIIEEPDANLPILSRIVVDQAAGQEIENEALGHPDLLGSKDDETQDNLIIDFHLSDYSIYDENRDFVSLKDGHIEHGAILYFSGIVKPIRVDNEVQVGHLSRIPVKDVQILDWCISGYGQDQLPFVNISSPSANYGLLEPSSKYHGFSQELDDGVTLSKMIIDMIEQEYSSESSLDSSHFWNQLVKSARNTLPNFSAWMLHSNAGFVIKQVFILYFDFLVSKCMIPFQVVGTCNQAYLTDELFFVGPKL